MKKFEILEESRLSQMEMDSIHGGALTCGTPLIGTYTVVSGCYSLYATCTFAYGSCIGTDKRTCLVITYTGAPGPGGNLKPLPIGPDDPIVGPGGCSIFHTGLP